MREALVALVLLKRRRPITNGPGGKGWAEGTTVLLYPARLTVRGIASDCNCTDGGSCSSCSEGQPLDLLLLGRFDPGLDQVRFIFWGLIATSKDHLTSIPKRSLDRSTINLPDNVQLVFGSYNTRTKKGWIAPAEHDLEELYCMFQRTHSLRRTFRVHEDSLRTNVLGSPEGEKLQPHLVIDLMARGRKLILPVECKELDEVGRVTLEIVSCEPISDKRCSPGIGPVKGEFWLRFRVRAVFISNTPNRKVYNDAWMVVWEDGTWNGIWVTEEEGGDKMIFSHHRFWL